VGAEPWHRGAYGGLPNAHAALHAWCAANRRTIGAYSLEVYGDWSDDPSKLETTIQYRIAAAAHARARACEDTFRGLESL